MSVDKFKAKDYEVKTGYLLNCKVAALVFLWTNWEVLFQLNPKKIIVSRIDNDKWDSSGFHFKAKFQLTKSKISVNNGKLEFFTFANYYGSPQFFVYSIARYARLNHEQIAYFGDASFYLPSTLKPFKGILTAVVNQATSYMNKIGIITAEKISADPELLKNVCGNEVYQKYLEWIDEEIGIREGYLKFPKHFTDVDSIQIDEKNGEWEKRINILFSVQPKNFLDLSKEDYMNSIEISKIDMNSALQKNRSIVEHIVKLIVEAEQIDSTGKEMVGELLKKLKTMEIKSIPEYILDLIQLVKQFGNAGTHTIIATNPLKRHAMDSYRISFDSTLIISEWFCSDYLNAAKINKKN